MACLDVSEPLLVPDPNVGAPLDSFNDGTSSMVGHGIDPSVGGKCDGPDRLSMTRQDGFLSACLNNPEAHKTIPRDRRKPLVRESA